MTKILELNIRKYYAFNIFRQFFLFAPVLVLFFWENNLSMTQILLLQSIYSIAIVLLEIPTGAFGDYFGRKTSISLGALIFAIGFGIYSIGGDFYVFLIAELVVALGNTLISGSDNSLIHSTLKLLGREKDYKKIEGRAHSLRLAGFMIASFFGGFIAHYSLRLTMTTTAIVALAAFFISMTFVEPRITTGEEKTRYRQIIGESFKVIKNHKLILWLIIYASLITALSHMIIWIYQPYFKLVNIPIAYFGILYVIFGLIGVLAARYTHEIESLFKDKGSLILLALLVIVPSFFLGLRITIFFIIFFAFHQIHSGISKTIISDRLLKLIPTSKSATILSINNLGERFVYAIIGPIFGYLIDAFSLSTALISLAITTSVITFILFIFYRLIPR